MRGERAGSHSGCSEQSDAAAMPAAAVPDGSAATGRRGRGRRSWRGTGGLCGATARHAMSQQRPEAGRSALWGARHPGPREPRRRSQAFTSAARAQQANATSSTASLPGKGGVIRWGRGSALRSLLGLWLRSRQECAVQRQNQLSASSDNTHAASSCAARRPARRRRSRHRL